MRSFVGIHLRVNYALFVALFSAAVAVGSAVEIVNVYPKHIEGKTFKRISEYFSGVENTSNRVIARSRPQERSGLYFIITFDEKADLRFKGAIAQVQLVVSNEAEIRLYSIDLPLNYPKSRELLIGITGSDWPLSETVPMAWKIILFDDQERILAQEESFLWNNR